jgi:hypothetical protein
MKPLLPLLLALCLLTPPAYAATAKMIMEDTNYGQVSYPEVEGLADKAIEDALNTAIKQEASTWNCDFDGVPANPNGMDYNVWSVIGLVNDTVLSYTVHKDYYCGGAHPVQQTDTRNYDLSTGAALTIETLLKPELSGAALTAFLLKDHVFAEAGCADAYTDINWDYYLTPGHVVFLPRLSDHSQTCWEEFAVANEKLAPYFPEGGDEDRD